MVPWRSLAVSVFCGALSLFSAPEKIRVAAASNLQFVMEPLAQAFAAEHSGYDLRVSHASTGNLVAQIRHGAPFDVLLAADLHYPRALITSGHAAPESLRTFAHGKLVLWPRPETDDSWSAVLLRPASRRLAIPNPETAPYGLAARELMIAAGIWEQLKPKIVWGENVAQTLQFVHSGNADYGFVAASLLAGNRDLAAGLSIELEPEALPHGSILLHASRSPAGARRFLTWLGSKAAQDILREHGYRVP